MLGAPVKKAACSRLFSDAALATSVKTPIALSPLAQLLDRRQLCGKHGQFRLDNRDFLLVLCLSACLFRALEGLCRLGLIQVLPADCGVGKHRHQPWLDFQDAAGNEDQLLVTTTRWLDTNFARLDARDQRGMQRIDAEFACLAGQHHEFRFAGVD